MKKFILIPLLGFLLISCSSMPKCDDSSILGLVSNILKKVAVLNFYKNECVSKKDFLLPALSLSVMSSGSSIITLDTIKKLTEINQNDNQTNMYKCFKDKLDNLNFEYKDIVIEQLNKDTKTVICSASVKISDNRKYMETKIKYKAYKTTDGKLGVAVDPESLKDFTLDFIIF
ncbi:hypothetical protein [Deferribacter abyssi]|uniref:hypothetical protein n=1 Tax=Deferribacter abyssi TaxID=213806 RepID=UPI003C23CE97